MKSAGVLWHMGMGLMVYDWALTPFWHYVGIQAWSPTALGIFWLILSMILASMSALVQRS